MKAKRHTENATIRLPSPRLSGKLSLESALNRRRSRRHFHARPIELRETGQVLWASYGITGTGRTSPSAGRLYPLTVYLIAGNVNGIEPGLYYYNPQEHCLHLLRAGDIRADLCEAASRQEMLKKAPAILAWSAVSDRVEARYGDRGMHRYIPMDIGHSAQNVYLQAEALGLGTCAVGAFDDDHVKSVLELPEGERPLYMMPVGYPKAEIGF